MFLWVLFLIALTVIPELSELRRFREHVVHDVVGRDRVGESVVEFGPDPPRRRDVGAGHRRGRVAGVGGEWEGGWVWFRAGWRCQRRLGRRIGLVSGKKGINWVIYLFLFIIIIRKEN
ncbi:unnamed protein product [Linum tenue]|uniref:Secreted protein n=1 Tax=Linum tenue TaxID=586396 RepID=A0AAV0J6J5_9ROSI|nr:unnamed protein product [Linum tenue]